MEPGKREELLVESLAPSAVEADYADQEGVRADTGDRVPERLRVAGAENLGIYCVRAEQRVSALVAEHPLTEAAHRDGRAARLAEHRHVPGPHGLDVDREPREEPGPGEFLRASHQAERVGEGDQGIRLEPLVVHREDIIARHVPYGRQDGDAFPFKEAPGPRIRCGDSDNLMIRQFVDAGREQGGLKGICTIQPRSI